MPAIPTCGAFVLLTVCVLGAEDEQAVLERHILARGAPEFWAWAGPGVTVATVSEGGNSCTRLTAGPGRSLYVQEPRDQVVQALAALQLGVEPCALAPEAGLLVAPAIGPPPPKPPR
jgi:hypothetical protein